MNTCPQSLPSRSLIIPGLFVVSVFLGAALLFLLEPLVGKTLLPWYGGAPAVWNTCLLFFQLLLLLGYIYAHLLHKFLSLGRQLVVHGIVTSMAWLTLPIRFDIEGLTGNVQHPVLSLLIDLTRSIGPVFFVVSTTAPLLQAWYAAARLRGSPYLLYVASNTGSLLGLLLYPTVLEFWYPLSAQRHFVTWGFMGLTLFYAFCGAIAWRGQNPVNDDLASPLAVDPPISINLQWSWFFWSLCPSILMMGVTTYLSAEIAPMPAIWMLPLSLYLLSFIIAFADPPPWVLTASVAGYVVLALLIALVGRALQESALAGLVLHNGVLFCGALALHSRLAATRPSSKHLTEFYLWISCGGVCGSVCNTLVFPLVFNWLAEYPLAIALGLWLLPASALTLGLHRRVLNGIRVALTVMILLGMSWNVYFSESSRYVLERKRTFFGEFHVERGKEGVMTQLVHGRTVHGMQVNSRNARERRPPLTYYFFTGPIGELILSNRGTPVTQAVGVVGLGIGSLAGYAEQGEQYTFYEIDPAIAHVAEDNRYFTFLQDARNRGAKSRVILGDARLKIRESADGNYGLLVLDAFTSDAIPVHLLTKEAVAEYFTKLKPGGILACHISNQFVDLEPVLANIAEDLGCVAYIFNDDHPVAEELRRGKHASRWVVLASSTTPLDKLLASGHWQPCQTRPELGVWTDDQSNLLRIMSWKR